MTRTTPPRETFEEVRQRLDRAVFTALESQAESRRVSLPAGHTPETVRDAAHDERLRQIFDRAPLALLGFDTPGIQSYIFQVQRQVDVMGGSFLVEGFTDQVDGSLYTHLDAAKIDRRAVIFAGGGSGLLVVPADVAASTADALEKPLSEATAGDLFSVATFLPIWPRDLSSEPPPELALGELASLGEGSVAASRYAATVAALEALKQNERSKRLRLVESLPTDRYIERCDACQRAKGYERSYPDGESYRICPGCEARRGFGQHERGEERQAPNFPDLVAGLSSRDLAVLYADGANVGGAFLEIRSMVEHAVLSQAVRDAMEDALLTVESKLDVFFKSLPGAGATENGKRYQTPVKGGDDLVVVLPATAAVAIVVPLIEAYERFFDQEVEPRLEGCAASERTRIRRRLGQFGLGFGLAIADHQFPIQFLLDYAGSLLKSAKARIDPDAGIRSAVDYLILRTGNPLSRDLEQLRSTHYRRPSLQLTERPYSLAGFKTLLDEVDALRRVTPSQVHAMRRELDHGRARSRSLWRYQHARAEGGRGWAAYREHLGRRLDEVDSLLWSKGEGDVYSTRYLDAFELFDHAPWQLEPEDAPSEELAP
ncbi:MAG: hypothetical protein AAGC60_06160 [Acidobacteriota bacterium]